MKLCKIHNVIHYNYAEKHEECNCIELGTLVCFSDDPLFIKLSSFIKNNEIDLNTITPSDLLEIKDILNIICDHISKFKR